jgi:hypothetical protein
MFPGASTSAVRGGTGSAGSIIPVPPVVITTTGSTFSPWVQVASSNVTVTWTWSGGQVAGLTPVISFGSAGTRQVTMTATTPGGYSALNQVTLFNVGFNTLDDPGRNTLPAFYNWPSQAVSGIANVNSMTNLQLFLAADILSLTGPVNFNGMSQLTHIECYQSSFTAASCYGCTSMVRLVLESNKITSFDLNPVAPTIQEFRAAFQQSGGVVLAPLTQGMPQLYHFCVRDQVITNMPSFTSGFPQLTQLWIWNTGQSGTLQTNSSVPMDSVLAHDNAWTTVNLANQFTYSGGQLTGQIALANCSIASANITGDALLGSIDFSFNQLSQAQVDAILTTVNGFGTSSGLGLLDVSGTGNAAPSGTGTSAAIALRGRGWTVNTN